VRLRNLLRGTPAAPEAQPRPRRRTPRPGGPRTIIPVDDVAAPAAPPAGPFARDVDAARERLRRAIPPVADDGR
jgi:hypothetical protein